MSDILEVDRDALGVTANSNWTDSQTFINIAHGFESISGDSQSTIVNFEQPGISVGVEIDNSGVEALRKAAVYLGDLMKDINFEFSDAAAMLGSGTESAITSFDSAEAKATENIDFIRDRLG